MPGALNRENTIKIIWCYFPLSCRWFCLCFLQEIEKIRAELEKAHGESRDQQLNQAVELALSHAHADWLKNDEEMRQREIDQAVEVAITNAVAEAKVEWEKEITAQVSTFKDPYKSEGRRIRAGFGKW